MLSRGVASGKEWLGASMGSMRIRRFASERLCEQPSGTNGQRRMSPSSGTVRNEGSVRASPDPFA